jgi:hypothetical protein
MVAEVAGKRLTGFLRGLDGVEKQVFALRGMAMLIVEERELYRWVLDEEVGDYYTSFDRWMKQELPTSWGYCRDALRAVKELKDMPFEDLLQIKRANLEQLKKVSSNVRILPEVVAAAKSLPEKAFVSQMNEKHNQHLETKIPIVMAPTEDVAEFKTALALAILCEGCTTRAEAIRAVSVSYIQNHQDQLEHSA